MICALERIQLTIDETEAETGRFFLHIGQPMTTATTNESCDQNDGVITMTQLGSTTWDTYEVKDDNNVVVASGSNFNGQVDVNQLADGNYTIELIHGTYVATVNVTVDPSMEVVADFTPSQYVVEEDEVIIFDNQTTGGTIHNWNMGDGTTMNGIANPSYSFRSRRIVHS